MYFVTETELRMNYRKAHFTEYQLEQGTRLTPEARQFLLDRNISFCTPKEKQLRIKKSTTRLKAEPYMSSYLSAKLEKISASFLLIISFLTEEDMYIAEQVMILENYLTDMSSENGEAELQTLLVDKTSVEKKHKITAFHIQLSRGKEIALLHFLLTDLKLLRVDLKERNNEESVDDEQYKVVEKKLEIICTALEELIHKAIGGKE